MTPRRFHHRHSGARATVCETSTALANRRARGDEFGMRMPGLARSPASSHLADPWRRAAITGPGRRQLADRSPARQGISWRGRPARGRARSPTTLDEVDQRAMRVTGGQSFPGGRHSVSRNGAGAGAHSGPGSLDPGWQPVCLIGDSGTGKSHLLIGLGTGAAEAGSRTNSTNATTTWTPLGRQPGAHHQPQQAQLIGATERTLT
jgi:hypothetical protein